MNHDDRKELLSALLDGELDEGARAEALAHLDGCAACRTYFAELAALHDALGGLEEPDVPEGFAAGVLARLHAEEAPRPAKKVGIWRKWGALAACAAVVLLAAATLQNALRMGRSSSADSAAATESAYAIMNAAPAAPAEEADEGETLSAALAAAPEAAEDKTAAMETAGGAPQEPVSAPTGAVGESQQRVASEAGVPVTVVTSGPNGETLPEAAGTMSAEGTDGAGSSAPVWTLSGEGAAQWLAENGVWSEADGAYRVDNEALDLLPEGLTLQYTDAAEEDGVWRLVRAAETEAEP